MRLGCGATFLLLSVALCEVTAFNIETRHPVVKSDDKNSWFGATVAFHSTSDSLALSSSRLLVGAPLANRSYRITTGFNAEVNVDGPLYEPGAVYVCELQDNVTCREVQFDQQYNTEIDPTTADSESMDRSWWPLAYFNDLSTQPKPGYPLMRQSRGFFGYYLRSGGPGKNVAACGHRISIYVPGEDAAAVDEWALSFAGACITGSPDFQANNFHLTQFCYNNPAVYQNQVAVGCLGGMGLAKYEVGQNMLQFIRGETGAGFYNGISRELSVVTSQSRVSREVPTSRAAYPGTSSSWFGLQSVEGKINKNGMVITSAPRCNSYQLVYDAVGRVFISTVQQHGAGGKRQFVLSVAGEQYGAQFGFSLASGKFTDSSGETYDLAIGAPFYTDYSQSGNYDHGRVYLYSAKDLSNTLRKLAVGVAVATSLPNTEQSTSNPELFNMSASSFLTSSAGTSQLAFSKAYFGYALANGGDMNNDGFEELVISAPGGGLPNEAGGTDGKGAVYIFYGRPGALDIDRPQIIYASHLDSSLQGFGSSISGGTAWDMDGNGYTDLAVGARKSNAAYFFKSRPVVEVISRISYFKHGKEIKELDLNMCNATSVCFVARICFHFKNRNRSSKKSSYNGPAHISVETCEAYGGQTEECVSDARRRRLQDRTFRKVPEITLAAPTAENAQDPLAANENCMNDTAYIEETIQDKLGSLYFFVKWTVLDKAPTAGSVTAIGTRYGMQSFSSELPLQTTCKHNPCRPDLEVVLNSISWPDKTSDSIVLGTASLSIVVNVTNKEDPASLPILTFKLPSGVSVPVLPIVEGVSCNQSTDGLLVDCPMPNPFEPNRTILTQLDVIFDISKTHNESVFYFEASIGHENSSTVEHIIDNNVLPIPVYTTRHTDFQVISPQISSVTFQSGSISTPVTVRQVGPKLSAADDYRFSILNNGPSPFPESEVKFSYPGILRTNKDDTSISYRTAVLYLNDIRADEGIVCRGLERLRKAYTDPMPSSEQFNQTAAEAPGNNNYITDCTCSTPACNWYCNFTFTCTLPRLIRGETSGITFDFVLSNTSLTARLPANFSTSMTVTLPSMAYEPNFTLSRGSAALLGIVRRSIIRATKAESEGKESANIGVIIGAVIGGIALVVLVVLGLYKCGFFKRKLPPGMEDQNWQAPGSGEAYAANAPPSKQSTDV